MVWIAVVESQKQHSTKQQLYGHLTPIYKTIQVRWTRLVGSYWRSENDIIIDVLPWTFKQERAAVGRLVSIYLPKACVDTMYFGRPAERNRSEGQMEREREREIEREREKEGEGEREYGKSMLAAWIVDDEIPLRVGRLKWYKTYPEKLAKRSDFVLTSKTPKIS